LLLCANALALSIGAGLGCGAPDAAAPTRSKGGRDIQLWGVAAEVREILLQPDALVRAEALAALFQALEPEALEQVRDAYDSVFLDLGDLELELLAEWWTRFDPESAFEWTSSSWQASHPRVVHAVMRGWARRDPEGALRAAEQQPVYSIRRPMVHAVLAGWEESGKPGAFEYVQALPQGQDRQRALYVLARRKVLRDGVEAAFRWAEAQPDGDGQFKLNLFRRVASSAAEVEPERAAAWAAEHAGGPSGNGLPRRVGTRWAKRDPETAMRWLSTLEPGPNRNDGVQETYRTWLRFGFQDAFAWLPSQPLEPWLDPAVALYAQVLAPTAPREALDWAHRISDEELRWPTVGRVWRVWALADEAAANAWLAQAELPDFYRERIPQIPEGMRRMAELGREEREPETPD
jgi:hypothetical protein